ncbi:hypothetical protein H6P81_013904 [Aristolochia fimbriata]|uniref:Exonuclease domain-containing protein n=1 Tax=Aristolochia fimbriata TaxID=158543 RepID=A0AAV7EIU7_ARIFI|nr:hypothetical protein H6P81_013904 [Aristolochia fimbriata]
MKRTIELLIVPVVGNCAVRTSEAICLDRRRRPTMGSFRPLCRCSSRVFASTSIHAIGAVLLFPRSFSLPLSPTRKLTVAAAVSTSALSMINPSSSYSQSSTEPETMMAPSTPRWKPTCLYYTQGQCTMMNEPMHLEKFNHDLSPELQVKANEVNNLQSQQLDYLLVLDLEGKVEILEFPVVMIDAKTMNYVDFFHRFVRPVEMSENRINEYIEGKYGKLGVNRVWHDTAIPFTNVLEQFEDWIIHHRLWKKEAGRSLCRAAFVTCGNWDLKTKVPEQCKVSHIKIPPYFMEWINLKDIYLNFYRRKAMGMRSMMNQLGIPLMGSHHLGIDDTKNIAKVVQRMLADGAVLQITARRNPKSLDHVEFLFKDRIR